MTMEETATILSFLKAAYPFHFKGQSHTEQKATLNLWYELFGEQSFLTMKTAVNRTILECERFMVPADVAKRLPKRQMTEEEFEAMLIAKNELALMRARGEI
jgi:hypothetical protein